MCTMAVAANFIQAIWVSNLRWSQIKFDLHGFPPFRILMQIVKTFQLEEITSIRQRKTISNTRSDIDPPVIIQWLIKDLLLRSTLVAVSKTVLNLGHCQNDAVFREMQTKVKNLAIPNGQFAALLSKFVNANTASTSVLDIFLVNTVTKPKEDLKVSIPISGCYRPRTEAFIMMPRWTMDSCPSMLITENEDVQPQVVQIQSRNPKS
ncbi:hypothetical protein Tco_0363335 [Tanacetum coccineum]